MTIATEIATSLAAQGMSRDEMIHFINGVTTYADLEEIHQAVDAAIAAARA